MALSLFKTAAVFCVLAILLISSPSRADDETRMVITKDQKAFVFIIEGKMVAILDAEGFHVRDDIHFAKVKQEKPEEFDKRVLKILEGDANE